MGVSGDTCTFCNMEMTVLCLSCAGCCCLGDAGCYLNIIEIQVTHLTGRRVKHCQNSQIPGPALSRLCTAGEECSPSESLLHLGMLQMTRET